VISTSDYVHRDYLALSIVIAILCCFVSLPTLICSLPAIGSAAIVSQNVCVLCNHYNMHDVVYRHVIVTTVMEMMWEQDVSTVWQLYSTLYQCLLELFYLYLLLSSEYQSKYTNWICNVAIILYINFCIVSVFKVCILLFIC